MHHNNLRVSVSAPRYPWLPLPWMAAVVDRSNGTIRVYCTEMAPHSVTGSPREVEMFKRLQSRD
jgi:hypothetical protein